MVNAVAQPAKNDEGHPSKAAKKYSPQAKDALIKTTGSVASTPTTVLIEKLIINPPKKGEESYRVRYNKAHPQKTKLTTIKTRYLAFIIYILLYSNI